jgi:hypothetical protein
MIPMTWIRRMAWSAPFMMLVFAVADLRSATRRR